LVLPCAGVHVTIGRTQVPGGRHQQHHGGVGDSRCVGVGAIGDRDAPASRGVQVDRFIARADGADDFELRKQRHLVAAYTATAVGQNGPDGIACLAHGVHPVRVLLPLENSVAGSG
jgi:hypothetical protein